MKKILPLLLISCAIVLFAKTTIPVMKKVEPRNTKAPQTKGQTDKLAQAQKAISPLDEPFTPKYVYPGTNISKNVIPIRMIKMESTSRSNARNNTMSQAGESLCSAFRFRRNWILTAAHCVEQAVNRTNNQRIYSNVDKQENGVMVVVVSLPDADHPANANVYFYQQGYTSNPNTAYGHGPRGHADDIALVRLDDVDASIPLAQANITRAADETAQAQAQMEQLLPKDSPVVANIEETNKFLQKAEKQLSAKQKIRKQFLDQPLDNYRFFILNPAQVGELNGRSATTVRFAVTEDRPGATLKLPDSFVWKYKGLRNGANHNVGWTFNEITIHESGSPLIINGFIVSNASGPVGEDTRETPLYAEQFQKFLVNSMGAEYPKGLCVQPISPDPLPTYQPK